MQTKGGQEDRRGRTLTRRRLTAAVPRAAAGCVVLAASGCGAFGGRAEVRPSSQKPVTLTWLASRSGAEVPVWQGMARAAEQRYPTYKVDYVNSADGWSVKLPALMAANSGPDIVRLEGNGFADMVVKGFFKDLSPYVQRDAAFNARDFIPQSLEAFKLDARQYAIPMVFSAIVMTFNTRLFAEAGIAPPAEGWTWNDYADKAKRLTRTTGDKPVWGSGWETTLLIRTVPFVWQNGGELFDKTNSKALFDQGPATDALEWLADMRFKTGVSPKPDDLNGTNVHTLFMRQQLAMIPIGPWQRAIYNGAQDLPWDVAPLPKGKKSDTTATFSGGYPITTQSSVPDDAWVLIRFLTGEDSSLTWAKMGTSAPARRSAALSKQFLSEAGAPKHAQTYVSYPERSSAPSPDFVGYADVNTVIEEELAPMWRGEAAPRAAATKAAARANELLQRSAKR
jgi:multiple sugar transport system substrate-binding protein